MTALSYAVCLTQDLVKCPSVTPAEGGALDLLEQVLTELGFSCTRLPFGEGEARIDNLFARIGSGHPHIAFAGHTDVVPTGDVAAWSCDPFAGEVRDGQIYGRGTADMKGGIAAFVAAVKTYLESDKLQGSISLIITGDEEGEARYGTVKMVEWLEETGQQPDFCIVGEPTNPNELGEMIKNGRRGSLSCRLRVEGVQGHVAYPHLANNPVPALFAMLAPVNSAKLDGGTDYFDPSTAEVTDIELVGGASNVIPQAASAAFNIRFNTEHSVASLQGWLEEHFDRVASQHKVTYQADFASNASPFITEPGVLTTRMQAAISRLTNKQASLSTTGGTSDARFICKICPVAEFGLVGQTMHKIDEHVAIADIDQLAAIYAEMLAELDTE
ncbi:MAG: succinyl-diaminopimelate desuccinylase [Candidatus Puniceispirillaceae bacterium]